MSLCLFILLKNNLCIYIFFNSQVLLCFLMKLKRSYRRRVTNKAVFNMEEKGQRCSTLRNKSGALIQKLSRKFCSNALFIKFVQNIFHHN